jgi:hypothetical protein
MAQPDERFLRIYNKCKRFTMTSNERMQALHKSVVGIVNSKIPGDLVECGVWKGGSAMLMALTLLELNETSRKIYLYDTFTGMPTPTDDDYRVGDRSALAKNQWRKDWCFSPLSEVKKNMALTRYPKNKLIFVKGKVEKTIPRIIPSKIALLRLDTDWYESTKHELIYLFPLVSKNGVLIIDDYGYWAGSKKATDEYFINKPMVIKRIDDTGIIGVKEEM